VARRERRTGAVLGPLQCLTRTQALHALTIGGAYFCGVETQRGSLTPGKYADLAVLSDDPLRVPAACLPDLHVHLTMAGGQVVYGEA
jgi:predicted amidohydrolase YtcJ